MWPWTYRARVGVWTANASDKIVRPWQESKVDVSLELDLKQTWKEKLLSQDLKVWKCASLHRVFVCLGNGHNCRWSTRVGPSPRSLQPTPIVQPSWVAPRKRQEKPCTAEPQARRLRDTADPGFFQFLFTVCSRDLSPVPLGKHYKKMKFKFECGLSNTNWKLHLYELYKRHLLSVDSGKPCAKVQPEFLIGGGGAIEGGQIRYLLETSNVKQKLPKLPNLRHKARSPGSEIA